MVRQKNFSEKVNRVLLFILLLFLGLGFRSFQLSILQQEKYVELFKNQKRKSKIESATRGWICDRNGLPLASNQICYQISISYDAIRKLPKFKYILENKKIQKVPFRTPYIQKLCSFLSQKLNADAYDLEDLIHGKASLFPNQNFVIKETLDPLLYFELRAKEKDWPGLKTEVKTVRAYPNLSCCSHIVGYLGRIHQKEYEKIQHELTSLHESLEDLEQGNPSPLPYGFENFQEVKDRYNELKEKYYQLSSVIGKAGIEGRFDEYLRGSYGKKKYEIDVLGRQVRLLPDSFKAKEGDTLILSIDKQLQEAAEMLLAQHEEKRDKSFRMAGKNHHLVQGPWIKGGAIVAMDAKTGQVLTLASYPRFNPNDFSAIHQDNKNQIIKWLELPLYFEKIWNGELNLEKELFNSEKKEFYTVEKKFTFETYIEMILSNSSKVKKQLLQYNSLKYATDHLNIFEQICNMLPGCPYNWVVDFLYPPTAKESSSLSSFDRENYNFYLDIFLENQASIELLKDKLSPVIASISNNKDKLLYFDLVRLFTPKNILCCSLPDFLKKLSYSEWFDLNQELLKMKKALKSAMKVWHHTVAFRNWRQEHFKAFLKEKRKWEKENKKPQKPYLDYLEEEERIHYQIFAKEMEPIFLNAIFSKEIPSSASYYKEQLEKFKNEFISKIEKNSLREFKILFEQADFDTQQILLDTITSFENLDKPLFGTYKLKGSKKNPVLKDLARHYYPTTGFGFSRSYAYQEAAPQGSIFKIVTAYEALRQQYEKSQQKDLNPLTITDNSDGKITDDKHQVLGLTSDGKKISRFYKGGKLPRSSKRCGKISIREALETSSNLYFSILAADHLKNPLDLAKAAKNFGYGAKTGIDLPGEISGIVPYDILANKTGLYAMSIGQHSLVVTPLQTAKMFSSIINGGALLKPQILHSKIKKFEDPKSKEDPLSYYNNLLGTKGSLFQKPKAKRNLEMKVLEPKTVLHKLFYPLEIQSLLKDSLKKVIQGERGTARSSSILFKNKEHKERYLQSCSKLIGKSSSAEINYHPYLDHDIDPILCKHIWFACAEEESIDSPSRPSIVIVVYLRYGDYGKEAAVLASDFYHEYLRIFNN